VIIDGRIADIAETGSHGALVIPQLCCARGSRWPTPRIPERNRGRRGLDVLQEKSEAAALNIKIGKTISAVRDVDISDRAGEAVRPARFVTNDFNCIKWPSSAEWKC